MIKKVGDGFKLSDDSKGYEAIMKLNHAIERYGARGYFASANTAGGFYSLFGEVYDEKKYKAVYILKGGPGTGKSTLMDTIAARAEREGYGFEALLCSSDAGSLDGIIIDELGTAILDGTAPHCHDPYYPGVCGNIINLGAYWNEDELKEHRGEIEVLFFDKSNAYARAYRLLHAAGAARGDVINAYERAADTIKTDAAVKRLMRQLLGHGTRGAETRRFISAYSTIGNVRLDTLDKMAKTTVTVSFNHGAGYIYMDRLREASRGLSATVCPDALLPEHCEAVYFPEEKVLYKLADGDEYENGDVRVNSARFISTEAIRQNRAKIRFSEKITETLTEEALSSLADAGRIHAEIETIYTPAMDFKGVTETARALEEKIFS